MALKQLAKGTCHIAQSSRQARLSIRKQMKGVLNCLVHTFRDNSHPHVGITTLMCFDYGMRKDGMEHSSELWIVVIVADTNSS